MEISASITVLNYNGPGQSMTLQCGAFFIDKLTYSGDPDICIIEATSIPISGTFKGYHKNRAWENTSLSQIFSQLAGESGMSLDFRAPDVQVERVDQDEESDGFLMDRLSKRNGLHTKVQNKTLIVTDEAQLDQQAPVGTYSLITTPLISYNLTTSAKGTIGGMKSSYLNPVTGRTTVDQFSPETPPEGRQPEDLDSENDRPDYPGGDEGS